MDFAGAKAQSTNCLINVNVSISVSLIHIPTIILPNSKGVAFAIDIYTDPDTDRTCFFLQYIRNVVFPSAPEPPMIVKILARLEWNRGYYGECYSQLTAIIRDVLKAKEDGEC
jgi:hypothetical protein